MIRLRDIETQEVVEMDEAANVQLIDGLHYTETKEVKTIGAKTALRELRAFEIVQVDTGFDDDEGPRVMTILPKRRNGIAMAIASALMAFVLSGCGRAAYSYTYTCYGQGCAQAPAPMLVPMYYSQQLLLAQPGRVHYVNRPMEIHVLEDGGGTIKRQPARPEMH